MYCQSIVCFVSVLMYFDMQYKNIVFTQCLLYLTPVAYYKYQIKCTPDVGIILIIFIWHDDTVIEFRRRMA